MFAQMAFTNTGRKILQALGVRVPTPVAGKSIPAKIKEAVVTPASDLIKKWILIAAAVLLVGGVAYTMLAGYLRTKGEAWAKG